MSLMNYGYKKEEIQIRKMTMAELRLGIVQELLKKNYRYVNIRLVNTTCGDVDSYRSRSINQRQKKLMIVGGVLVLQMVIVITAR